MGLCFGSGLDVFCVAFTDLHSSWNLEQLAFGCFGVGVIQVLVLWLGFSWFERLCSGLVWG